MKEDGSEKGNLEKVFIEFIGHTKSQNEQTSTKMDKLATEMSSLARAMVRSEERHTANYNGMTRLGKALEKTNEAIDKQNTRITDNEKQILLLGQTTDINEGKFAKIGSVFWKVFSALLVAAIIGLVALINTSSLQSKSPVTASVKHDKN